MEYWTLIFAQWWSNLVQSRSWRTFSILEALRIEHQPVDRALSVAVYQRNPAHMRRLLSWGANPHVGDGILLSMLCGGGCAEGAELLLQAGVDPNCRSGSPYAWAALRSDVALESLLLRYGAVPVPLHAPGPTSWSPSRAA